jgi:hypothetical protein
VIVDQMPGRSGHRIQIATGTACAAAGHLVAGGPWLYTVFTFTAYAEPDSVFLVACLTAALELMLLLVCMTLGLTFLRSRRRHVGIGLLTGWFVGVIAVPCGGSAVIGLLAA